MQRTAILTCLLSLFGAPAALGNPLADIFCQETISPAVVPFVAHLSGTVVRIGFLDGDIHELSFVTNELGIVTGTYRLPQGQEVYSKMELLECLDASTQKTFLMFYRPAGDDHGYRHAARVLVPVDTALFESKRLPSLVDLRWGTWKSVVLLLKN
jgi:hypothetical protein